MQQDIHSHYWYRVWRQFRKHFLGMTALYVILLFILAAVYAPFLASSKPLFLIYDGAAYFPLFRYLFYSGFYTKSLDIFFNLFIFTLPVFIFAAWLWQRQPQLQRWSFFLLALAQTIAFGVLKYAPLNDPASNAALNTERHKHILENPGMPLTWDQELHFMTPYAELNLLTQYLNWKHQNQSLMPYLKSYQKIAPDNAQTLPTLWQLEQEHTQTAIHSLTASLDASREAGKTDTVNYRNTQIKLNAIIDKQQWLDTESQKITWRIMPLLSSFHWEDDAGGQEALNKFVPWWDLTRINRKNLLSALIFGIRISIVVGLVSVGLALIIGIPIGALAGYYGGTSDIVVSRLLEIWESMPTFFMLLMIVGILQSKSIFLVIAVIGVFGWTGFSRYIRGEFFKQRNLPYVEACKALGFRDGYIMFRQILPNAISPVLALLPFAIMGAITSEAGLSFLGLGEEGSCSWGVLMDEGRSVFPQESYLLWPPAILLTVLLIAIALVGDSLRDAIDPKSQID